MQEKGHITNSKFPSKYHLLKVHSDRVVQPSLLLQANNCTTCSGKLSQITLLWNGTINHEVMLHDREEFISSKGCKGLDSFKWCELRLVWGLCVFIIKHCGFPFEIEWWLGLVTIGLMQCDISTKLLGLSLLKLINALQRLIHAFTPEFFSPFLMFYVGQLDYKTLEFYYLDSLDFIVPTYSSIFKSIPHS